MHIPQASTLDIDVMSFDDALSEETAAAVDYDKCRWLYVPCHYS